MRNRIFLVVVTLFLSLSNASAQEAAPEFDLATYTGDRVSLAELRGRVVYVDFWATWCSPCRKSFPWMEEMHQRYHAAGLEVVAISLDHAQEPIGQFLKALPASFVIALDPQGTTADRYKVKGMPTSYLIDRKGNIYLQHTGFRDRDKTLLEDHIKKILARE